MKRFKMDSSPENIRLLLTRAVMEARQSALQGFGTPRLQGLVTAHVAVLLQAALPYKLPLSPGPQSGFRFLDVEFRVIRGTGLLWRIQVKNPYITKLPV